MSGESGKTPEVPVPSNSSSTLPVPTAPPKRFLGASHTTSQRKPPSSSLGSSPLPPALVLPGLRTQPTSSSSTSIVSPPKLTRFPTVVLTPVDITKITGKGIIRSLSTASVTSSVLPRPPPLIKMPLSTRKDRRAAAAVAAISTSSKNEDTESVVDDTDKPQEPPRKRTRAATEKSGESSNAIGGVVTPRKIIQEIFGPDKSKKPKGKGRKKRRGGPIPRKKVLQDETTVENIEEEDDDNNKEEGDNEDHANVQDLSGDVEELEGDKAESGKDDEKVGDEEQMPNLEQQEKLVVEVDLTEDSKSETAEVEKEDDENEEATAVGHEEEEKSEEQEDDKEERVPEVIEDDKKSEKNEEDEENQDENQIEEEPEEPEEKQQILPRRASRRKAKSVAKEKLKRLSKCEDGSRKGTSSTGTPEDQDDVEEEEVDEKGQNEKENDEEEDDDNSTETREENGGPASIHSRRSTTEGSSKSFGSSIQLDLESSYHHPHFHRHLNKYNGHDEDGYRQNFNPTPLSLISEDDSGKDEEDERPHGGNVSEDQKDSDVDSTYSWKPVRAAAAAALEQVTKNQGGSGSGDILGDAEAKAAAAAERRARKIMRYKGRNRRSLLFKSSSSKRYTAVRNNRYSAQPTIAPKVYHHGHYFQAGDIVSVELADSTHINGQVRGLIMDHFGEISAGIRFLAPKHPIYALMDFEPLNYSFRYDMPEKLVKIEFIEFVMHLNLDYFDGQPSFSKIEKGTMYTRIGKEMQSHNPNELDNMGSSISRVGASSSSSSSSEDSDDDGSSTTSSGDSDNVENKEKNEKNKVKVERHRHLTDSSTDADAEVEEDNDTVEKKDDETHENADAGADDVKIKDEIENLCSPVTNNNDDTDTKVAVDVDVSV